MIKIFILISVISFSFFHNKSIADVCETLIIKDLKKIKEQTKTCRPGNRILIRYDTKNEKEILILNLCDLKYSIVEHESVENITKRSSGHKIVCIFKPSKRYSN